MFDLDLLIVTFKRTKFLYQTINSYINIKKNYNFRLVILDGAGDQHKEELEGQNLSTREMIKKYFSSLNYIYYKQYDNNGDWAKIISDYVYNFSEAKNFVIVGDDDKFLNLEGFNAASGELNRNEDYSICNIHYKDNILGKVNNINYNVLNGQEYINNFIDKNFINTQSVIHIFKLQKIKENMTVKFLNLRSEGLEDFFGWDMYFLFFTALSGKVKYLKTENVVEMGHQGNEVRYTVLFPLTQWICYYIYSKYTLKKLIEKKVISRKIYRKFLLHWVDSFFICYSKYLFSEYKTREEDFKKTKDYLKSHPVFFVLKEIFLENFLINKIIFLRILKISAMKILFIRSKFKKKLLNLLKK